MLFMFYVLCFYVGGFFHPVRNLDEVFTYNHMALMSLRIHYHVKVYRIYPWWLTRDDHYFIYILQLIYIDKYIAWILYIIGKYHLHWN